MHNPILGEGFSGQKFHAPPVLSHKARSSDTAGGVCGAIGGTSGENGFITFSSKIPPTTRMTATAVTIPKNFQLRTELACGEPVEPVEVFVLAEGLLSIFS